MAKKAKAVKSSKVKVAKTKIPPPSSKLRSFQPVLVHQPTSEIAVTQAHSFELAKTVMAATISTIASFRKIFPGHRFAIRTYDCADPEVSYESFINGSGGKTFAFERSEDTLNWKILVRGSDPAVDKLLDWIEIAASDALQKKYLAKLQLSFHSLDGFDVSDSNLLEAYNMTFSYESGTMRVGTSVGENDGSNSIVLRNAKKDLYTLVNDVAWLVQERDPLPAQRRMNMKLLYNNTCPPDYEPPGFHSCSDPATFIAGNRGTDIGTMDTGFHCISIKLFQQDQRNSQEIKTQPHARVGDIFRVADTDGTSPVGRPRAEAYQRAINVRSARLRNLSMSSELDEGQTQEYGLRWLKAMGGSRNLETQDTQLINETPNISSTKNVVLPTSQDCVPALLLYSEAVNIRIDQARQQKEDAYIREEDYDLDEDQSSGRHVVCECGALADKGNLIQCDLCDNFKHVQCYGYLGSVPSASKFACYTCLLEFEETVLSQMKVTCLNRRALCFLRERGVLNSIEDLAEYLSRDTKTTQDILDQLKGKGYVAGGTDHRTAGRNNADSLKPLFTFVADDGKLLSHFFRPELDISEHLAIPESSSSGNTLTFGSSDDNSQPDFTMTSKQSRINQDRDVLEPMHTAQEPSVGDFSSTEGTPSLHYTARRFSKPQSQTPADGTRPSSFGGSMGGFVSGSKRQADLVLQREPRQSVNGQYRTIRTTLDEDSLKRTKISAANSPWVLRSLDTF